MNRLSYEDLAWEPVCLQPSRYSLTDGVLTPWGAPGVQKELVCVDAEHCTASMGMPAGQGKVSDAGYDQMMCLAAAIPACDHVVFRGTICIRRFPLPEEQNGQEGLGLFFRDTLEPDPITGYPYSNMIAGGIFRGALGVFGREGILPGDVEQIRTISRAESAPGIPSHTGGRLEILLEKHEARVAVTIAPEGSVSPVRFEIPVDEEIFFRRERDTMYLGFLAARGCEMEIDLDTVSVEYGDEPENGDEPPVLYASPAGTGLGMGTADAPLDLQSAIDQCQRGQEVRILPGQYRLAEDLVISPDNGGSRRRPKKLLADSGSGAKAILDFCGCEHGFRIEGNCWEIGGLTVTGGLGFLVSGSGNQIRDCLAIANRETGFLIRHPSVDGSKRNWPSNNEIVDCVSCLNADASQQHADGFACKIAAGPGNRFIRCTAWMNSDDGFDLFSKNRAIGPVRLEECRSWLNGYLMREGKPVKSRGNGNGFKLGGSGVPVDHEALDCEAVGNRGSGFTSNSNPRLRLSSCRAANNGKNFVYYFTGPQARPIRILENCTESDDPAFDPAAWARKHLPLHEAITLPGEGADDRPGVLIMCSSLYGGGAERVACRLACGLSDQYRVYMLYIRDKGQTYYLDPAVQTIAMPYFECGSFEELMDRRAAYVRQLKEDLSITAAVSFMFTMNKLNVHSPGKARMICSERNNPAKRDPDHLQEIESIYEAADHVVFQSETVRSLFSRRVRDHSSIILNPVNVSCGRVGGRHRIVNVARLTPQKNQAMLLRAFAAFHRTHSDYTLSFYGEGELAGELQALAETLELKDAVEFHSQSRDVHSAIADAEIFALSSDYEGLSNALLECMMMGFPCISTRCEGSSDVIRSGENGILVAVGSEEEMAAAMALLADDAHLRETLGAQARKTSELFQTEPVIGQWKQLIAGLINPLSDACAPYTKQETEE